MNGSRTRCVCRRSDESGPGVKASRWGSGASLSKLERNSGDERGIELFNRWVASTMCFGKRRRLTAADSTAKWGF